MMVFGKRIAVCMCILSFLAAGLVLPRVTLAGGVTHEVVAAGIYDAENLAFDRHGRLFVTCLGHLYMACPDEAIAGNRGLYTAIDFKAVYAGLAIGPDGYLYAACYAKDGTKILRINIEDPSGAYEHSVFLEGTIGSPNGLRFDEDGILYAADFNFFLPGRGKLWRIEADPDNPAVAGRVTPLVTGLWAPNGIVIDKDRGRLYFTETLSGKIYYLQKTGDKHYDPRPQRLIDVDMPGPRAPVLDDLALGADGALYVCHYNGNRILVISPEGAVVRILKPDGLDHPTALAFGVTGQDVTTLYATEKGRIFIKDRGYGNCLSRMKNIATPYRLPFIGP